MSNVCCKEFIGWIKSFTKTERALTVLEAVLLVVLITLLILLILHFIACSKQGWADDLLSTTPKITKDEDRKGPSSMDPADEMETWPIYNASESSNHTTAGPDVKCSWTPSAKTTAVVRYYDDGHTHTLGSKSVKPHETSLITNAVEVSTQASVTNKIITEIMESTPSGVTNKSFEDLIRDELSDGEEAEHEYDKYVLALVKLKPPKDIIFGCILTIVSEYWTLTAASCVEAIEETDSLDSFVMMEHYGLDNKGPLQSIDDIQIHPLYEGKNKSYDLAALKSTGSLTRGMKSPIELASYLDFALLPLAEKLIILGYGAFRSIESGPGARRVRRARVHLVAARQCAGGGGAALRHLGGGRAAAGRGACGRRALCAGVLHSRGLPCNYCAGAPLVARGALLALMAAWELCAAACEPALYVALPHPDLADWIDATLRSPPQPDR